MTTAMVLLAVLAVGAVLWGLRQTRRAQAAGARLAEAVSAHQVELAALNERVRRGLDGVGAALWEWRLTDDTIHVSDLFLEMTGYAKEDLAGGADEFFGRIHPDERGDTRRELERYLRREVAHCEQDFRFRCRDGHDLWMHLRAVGSWDGEGRPLSVVGSFTDISGKMVAEEERDRLFNLSTDMLSVGGFDGMLHQINPAWVRILGWSRDELMGQPVTRLVHKHDADAFAAAWAQLGQGTPVLDLEARFLCRDRSYRWLSWGSFPYAGRELVFSVVRDITVRKQAEEQLMEYQQRLRSLTNELARVEDRQRRDLAAAIHDGLAQQLFGVRAQMVLLKYPEKVPNLQEVVEGILAILDDTMAEARTLSFELFPPVLYEVGLEAALVWLCHNFSERTDMTCTCTREGEGEEMAEDLRTMAYQCVRELINNVGKHAQARRVDVVLNYVPGYLTVLVEDDGVGFDVEEAADGRKQDATGGFGLFSIRERMRAIEGRMLVDSRPGSGTRVFLSFPHTTADEAPPAADPLSGWSRRADG